MHHAFKIHNQLGTAYGDRGIQRGVLEGPNQRFIKQGAGLKTNNADVTESRGLDGLIQILVKRVGSHDPYISTNSGVSFTKKLAEASGWVSEQIRGQPMAPASRGRVKMCLSGS